MRSSEAVPSMGWNGKFGITILIPLNVPKDSTDTCWVFPIVDFGRSFQVYRWLPSESTVVVGNIFRVSVSSLVVVMDDLLTNIHSAPSIVHTRVPIAIVVGLMGTNGWAFPASYTSGALKWAMADV